MRRRWPEGGSGRRVKYNISSEIPSSRRWSSTNEQSSRPISSQMETVREKREKRGFSLVYSFCTVWTQSCCKYKYHHFGVRQNECGGRISILHFLPHGGNLSLDGFRAFRSSSGGKKASHYSGIWNRSVCESSLFSSQTAPK